MLCVNCGHRNGSHALWCGDVGFAVPEPGPVPAKVISDGGSTPDLYGIPTGARDIDDLISHRGMTFRTGNIFKAAWRIGRKVGNDDLYDLRKIIFNAEREIERIEGRGR